MNSLKILRQLFQTMTKIIMRYNKRVKINANLPKIFQKIFFYFEKYLEEFFVMMNDIFPDKNFDIFEKTNSNFTTKRQKTLNNNKRGTISVISLDFMIKNELFNANEQKESDPKNINENEFFNSLY